MPIHSKFFAARAKAFSLVEVVVAVGIFAIAVVSVVGLVGALTRSVVEIEDSDAASRVVSNLQSQLQTIPFATLRAYMGPVSSKSAGNRIYASRDGSKVGLGSASLIWDPEGTLNTAEEDALKYFAVELLSNDTLSPSGNDNSAGFLAFTVRLVYPAYSGDGAPIPDSAQQSSLVFPLAITR